MNKKMNKNVEDMSLAELNAELNEVNKKYKRCSNASRRIDEYEARMNELKQELYGRKATARYQRLYKDIVAEATRLLGVTLYTKDMTDGAEIIVLKSIVKKNPNIYEIEVSYDKLTYTSEKNYNGGVDEKITLSTGIQVLSASNAKTGLEILAELEPVVFPNKAYNKLNAKLGNMQKILDGFGKKVKT